MYAFKRSMVGEREAESRTVNLRTYQAGKRGDMDLADVVTEVRKVVAERTFDVEVKPLRSFEDADSMTDGGVQDY